RTHLSEYAPKMLSTKVPVDKIREVIGSGGKVIQKICAECDVKVDIDDEGNCYVGGISQANCERALDIIETIVNDPEVGAYYNGKVARVMDFGAFVEIAPGKEGLVHISRLDIRRVDKVTDVVNVGDAIKVKVLEIDDKGRLNLSRRDALIDLDGAIPENTISDAPRRPSPTRRPAPRR
ncbi:MAG: S1 RNA-binding domain-containing protein, partial [Clostridia bacterium]